MKKYRVVTESKRRELSTTFEMLSDADANIMNRLVCQDLGPNSVDIISIELVPQKNGEDMVKSKVSKGPGSGYLTFGKWYEMVDDECHGSIDGLYQSIIKVVDNTGCVREYASKNFEL